MSEEGKKGEVRTCPRRLIWVAEGNIHRGIAFPVLVFICPYCKFVKTAKEENSDYLMEEAINHLLEKHRDKFTEVI